MDKKIVAIYILVILFIAATGWGFWYADSVNKQQQKDFDAKILALQKQVSSLGSKVALEASSTQASALSQQEVDNRQQVMQKSQDQLLTDAVAKVTPSVVSIIISEDVPQYSVTYVNPFGDDPFFQNSGIQMPVYQQNGTQNQEVGAGTGSLITSDGYILTNKHVVDDANASYTVLLSNGKQQLAKVIFKDPSNDLAIVKIGGSGYTPVTLGNSDSLKLGESVFAVGNALGQYNNSVSVGVISGLNRSIQASDQSSGATETLNGVIQTDAAINPGNSGGPLSDLNGNVVGVNVATTQGANNVSFSLPINSVKQTINFVLGK